MSLMCSFACVNGSKVSQTFSPPQTELIAHSCIQVGDILPVFSESSIVIGVKMLSRYTGTTMMEMQCVVTGKVQGVSYRAYAQDSADSLGLCGWVKNGTDGSVLVCAQGEPDLLKEYVEYLHEGSLRAEVHAVSVEWQTAKKIFTEFSIMHA